MEKKKYIKHRIEILFLDNEISLALASTPPGGPGETNNATPHYLQTDPFRTNLG